jgi:hypothetical protein
MTKAMKLKVVGIAAELLCIGWNEGQVRKHIRQKFNITAENAKRIVNYVYEKWKNEGEQDMRIKRRRAIEARRTIIRTGWQLGNLDIVLRAEDSLAVIEGTRYNQKTDEDSEIVFQIAMKKSKDEEVTINEYADDLENPEENRFEKRCERQLSKFVKQHGVKIPDGKNDEIKKGK